MVNPNSVPGMGTTKTATPRKILLTPDGAQYLPGGKIINGSLSRDPKNTGDLDVLRAGLLMGEITATGLYAPSVLGLVTADTSAASTDVEVEEAAADELERREGTGGAGCDLVLVGPPTDTGVVSISAALQYNSIGAAAAGKRTITLNANCPAVYVDGSFLCAPDGTHLPKAIIVDEYGLKVTDDDNTTNLNIELARMLVGGQVDASQIINYPAAALTTMRAWVKAQLRANSIGWLFDDDF